jgi:hypothetical protein
MSCDWDVRCLDCEVDAGFDDTNHAVDAMRALAKRGPELAALGAAFLALSKSLEGERGYFEPRMSLRELSYGWNLDAAWWVKHGRHQLVAVDEYGRCDDACNERFDCKTCHHTEWCKRVKGHEGDHGKVRDKETP